MIIGACAGGAARRCSHQEISIMATLSDTQRVLLSAASQRANSSLLPLPTSITRSGATKAITALLKRGLAAERETSDVTIAHRQDGDLSHGVFITHAGCAAIGVDLSEGANTPPIASDPVASASEASFVAQRSSKAMSVLDLLRRPQGATLLELIELTGWLPHTTRAALTGIRKKGHDVTRSKREGATCYTIVEPA
jgi:hypothetical protein